MSQASQLEQIATHLIMLAKEAGACHADTFIVADKGDSISVRMGSIESIEHEDSQAAGLRAFVEVEGGMAFASASSSDLSEAGLKALAEQTVTMARISEPDPDAVPPVGADHPDAEAIRHWQEKHPFRPHGWDVETAKQQALACEQAARSYHADISNSEGAQAAFGETWVTYASSDGFISSYPNVSVSLSTAVIGGEGDEMQIDYAYDRAQVASELKSAEELGIEAAERTIKRMHAKNFDQTLTCPVVYEPRVAKSLLGHLISGISGRAVLQNRSFLSESMGQQILPEFFQLMDHPDHPDGLGNRLFDGEGTVCRPLEIISNGVLQTWLVDRYCAGRLNMKPTGHARRGLTGDTSIGSSNLVLQPGTQTQQEILQEIQSGILITELMGFGVNGVTGDYSRGAAGFLIENGELTDSIQAFTIAGNLKDMFRNISHIGSDLTWFGSTAVPSICVQGMTVAGQE